MSPFVASNQAVTPWPATTPSSPSRQRPAWSLQRRLGFRFVASLVLLWLVPFPCGFVPGTGWVTNAFTRAWTALVTTVGTLVLHRSVSIEASNSSDKLGDWLQLGLLFVLAAVAAAVLSAVDRRRWDYERASRWLDAYLRFFVGATLLTYGFDKVFHAQFVSPSPWKLEERFGEASPMGLLWTFMGYSTPYSIFTGLAEVVPAILLFFRRTATLGALLLALVMTNVVLLNFCYDVPVKIFSTELWLASVYLAAPRFVALFDVLVRGRPVAAWSPTPLFARAGLDRAARIGGVALGAWFVYSAAVEFWHVAQHRSALVASSTGPAGLWDVVAETRDGALVATDDATHWQRLGISAHDTTLLLSYRRVDGEYERQYFVVDRGKKTLTIDPDPGEPRETWTFSQPDEDHLMLSGALDGHTRVIELRRDRSRRAWRLMTRGFHLVNNGAYNL